MDNTNKGKSPFYPGQPVPIDFFIGRMREVERISRAIGQVELGKPQSVFLTGEYGIGKSSLAGFMKFIAEQKHHLLGIHILLGGSRTIEDIATKTVESIIKSQAYRQTSTERIRTFLAKYIGKQELFGFSINLEMLKVDSPTIARGYLPFLNELFSRTRDDGTKGIMLIIDEINGITENPQFAHFIKTLVDENALSENPLPLLLMLCGVDERRRELIQHHRPIERIFDIVDIAVMDEVEMKKFFTKTFSSVNLLVNDEAIALMCHYSAGFPKIMHIIGDEVFWQDSDNFVDKEDAIEGITSAASDVGKKFVEQQVYKSLHSKDYRSILTKLAKETYGLAFEKGIIEKGFSDSEKKKFNNFLQKMKKLNVLKPGEKRGEYVFHSRMVPLYIFLNYSRPK